MNNQFIQANVLNIRLVRQTACIVNPPSPSPNSPIPPSLWKHHNEPGKLYCARIGTVHKDTRYPLRTWAIMAKSVPSKDFLE